jgi:predicted lipoprotein with Yx(FWY)xxD motif
MKRLLIGVAAAALMTSAAFAMDPAKTMDTSIGEVFATQDGMTLYMFDKDESGVSNCYDQCAANWPPFSADSGATADGDWTLVKRTDGSMMWAYDGMPLYTFVKDTKPGDVNGDGVASVWHAALVNPD